MSDCYFVTFCLMLLFCPVAFYSPPITIYHTPIYEPIAHSIHVSWLCILNGSKKKLKKHRLLHPLVAYFIKRYENPVTGSRAPSLLVL